MKKRLTLLGLIVLFIIGLYLFSSYGFIEISIESSSSSQATYTLTSPGRQHTIEIKNSDKTTKKLVKKGDYEVVVDQNDLSAFSIERVGGFLGTHKTTLKVMSENGRKFVGNNPGPCMEYVNKVLLSFSCGSIFTNTSIHEPANDRQPTLTQKTPSPNDGSIEGTVQTKEGHFILLQAAQTDEEDASPHTLYKLTPSGGLTEGVGLQDLAAEGFYSLKSFDEGFLLINSSFNDAYYYSSHKAKGSQVSLSRPKDESLSPYTLSSFAKTLAIAYTEKDISQHDHDDNVADKVKSEVVIQNGDTSRSYGFKQTYSSVVLCSQDVLCLLGGDRLEAYDISGNKQRLLYAVSNVRSFEATANSILVVRDEEILSINAREGKGYISYAFESNQVCGLKTYDANYLICLINPRNDKYALYIDQSVNNNDSIDKKITGLLGLQEISDVSVYENYIYISPNLGELVYNEQEGEFNYNPSVRKSVADKINLEIDKLGIDRTKYKIINTLE